MRKENTRLKNEMYEQAQGTAGAGPDMGQAAGAGAGSTAGGASDDGVVDGDYREV